MAGRKKIVIDWEKVDKMLMAGANGAQCAAMLGVHPDTLYNKCKEAYKMDFSAYSLEKREKGNSLLLAKQYDLAMNGDRGMLIWLGKQRLEQSDKKEVKQEHTGGLLNVSFTSTGVKPKTSESEVSGDG